MGRTVAALLAVLIMVSTGVAWGSVRSFESGIFHFATGILGGGGSKDGALDIMLVGMDSRTDAHGNPLSTDELAQLHAGDDVATNTDTIILVRIPDNGRSATAISIPRDSYVEAPGLGKTTLARILARCLTCEQGPTGTPCGVCRMCTSINAGQATDVVEIDGASNTGVDQVRDLQEMARFLPQMARFKIFIIDEVHNLRSDGDETEEERKEKEEKKEEKKDEDEKDDKIRSSDSSSSSSSSDDDDDDDDDELIVSSPATAQPRSNTKSAFWE